MHLVVVGGSDAGISAALRARDAGGGAARGVDVAAAAIHSGLSVAEISDLDLTYTPPLGSPWDAVQIGAQAWDAAR